MKKAYFFIISTIVASFLSGCSAGETPESVPFPTTAPEIAIPDVITPGGLQEQVSGEKYHLDSSISGYLFTDSEVMISGDNIEIGNTIFINSQVFVNGRSNVVFRDSIFKELDKYEKAALNVYESENITVMHCRFLNNYIGMGIHVSEAVVKENRFENNNGHNALVIGEGSQAVLEGNYFYGNFPHAILAMNRESLPQAKVDIINNLFEQTGEDAINFEDYRNASPSRVAGNIIRDTGWSAVNVEYNSWNSNITISGNWIEGTGIEWDLPVHSLQTDVFQSGWGHGILIEDSSRVTIEYNRILSAGENGIEVRNGRDIIIRGNGINCVQTGIGAYAYHSSSLSRPFSPLSPENAGGTQATASNNIIYEAGREFEVDDLSELIID